MTISYVPLSTLYPLISTEASGLNENTAIDHLRWAARQFMQETNTSQDELDADISAGDPTLFVSSPSSNVLIHRVMSVQAPDRMIPILSVQDLNRRFGAWRARTGSPYACTAAGPGEMLLVPSPTKAETGLIVRVSLVPTLNALVIDKDIADRYAEIIADGALSRILRLTGQPWTDPRAADDRRRSFTIETIRARPHGTANQGFTQQQSGIRRQF